MDSLLIFATRFTKKGMFFEGCFEMNGKKNHEFLQKNLVVKIRLVSSPPVR
jgi:hypothetical protein